MLIDLSCSHCGRNAWLTWAAYLDAMASDSPRRKLALCVLKPSIAGGQRGPRGEFPMLTTRHPVDFPYTLQELQGLFRIANEEDVEKGGRYDARSAAVNIWSHHWQHPATQDESDTIGTFYFHWAPTPKLYEIKTDEGFDLMTSCKSSGSWS
jgi:hypothetical protein